MVWREEEGGKGGGKPSSKAPRTPEVPEPYNGGYAGTPGGTPLGGSDRRVGTPSVSVAPDRSGTPICFGKEPGRHASASQATTGRGLTEGNGIVKPDDPPSFWPYTLHPVPPAGRKGDGAQGQGESSTAG